jgi:N-acetylglutamate synthase-like GNAT family acetyltransferase
MTPLRLVSSRAAALEHAPEVITVRTAAPADAPAIHALIEDHRAEGHLLPRTLSDVSRSAERFIVAVASDAEGANTDRVVACGELAPLGRDVAEIRSLVVDRAARRQGVGERIFATLKDRAERLGFERLCAFTHEPRYFIRLGFSIVPHTWVPEKISADCCSCPQFRRCGQFGMLMDLAASATARRERAYLFG